MQIKVSKKYIRKSPDKIRLVINIVRGMNALKAKEQLMFLNKAAAKDVMEVLKSALAAAKDKDAEEEKLFVKEIRCDEGPRLKRRRLIHRGRASAIDKKSSHITLIISDEEKKKTIKKVFSEKNINKKEKEVKQEKAEKKK
jgi:large subunit ribosomal protein L22